MSAGLSFTSYVLASSGLAWTFYRVRLWQGAREFERTLQARAAERTRIARDLHDTMLGSFNALLLHLEATAILFQTQPDEARQTLDSTIAQAARAIDEGREAVQGLRRSVAGLNDLPAAIARVAGEILAAPTPPQAAAKTPPPALGFQLLVEGATRCLHPMVLDEVYRVAMEALRNAFQHSHGTRIEVELIYHTQRFRLRIRDDGRGIDPRILAARGREGHFGIQGMYERAELAGGTLELWSARGAGTEVQLTIPGIHAYPPPPNRGIRKTRRRQHSPAHPDR